MLIDAAAHRSYHHKEVITFSRSRALEIEHHDGTLRIGGRRAVSVTLPSTWSVARRGRDDGRFAAWIAAPENPRDDAFGAPLCMEVTTTTTSDEHELALHYLRRRMPSGAPAPLVTEVQGRTGLFQDWTDGVADIATWFVVLAASGPMLAIGIVQVSCPALAEHVDPTLLGARALHGVEAGWVGACDEEIVAEMRAMEPPQAAAALEERAPTLTPVRRIRLLRRACGLGLAEAVALTQRGRSR